MSHANKFSPILPLLVATWFCHSSCAQQSANVRPSPVVPIQVTEPNPVYKVSMGVEAVLNIGHGGEFQGASVADPTGRFLASYTRFSPKNELFVWDLASGFCVWRVLLPVSEPGGMANAAFSPTGELLVYSRAGESLVYDIRSRTLRYKLSGECPFGNHAFSPDGKLLCLSQYSGTTLIDVPSGELVAKLDIWAKSIRFAQSGHRMLIDDGYVTHLLDLNSNRVMQEFKDVEFPMSGSCFSGSNDRFTLLRADYSDGASGIHWVDIHDAEGDVVQSVSTTEKCLTAQPYPDGDKILILTKSGECITIDARNGTPVLVIGNTVTCVTVNSKFTEIAAAVETEGDVYSASAHDSKKVVVVSASSGEVSFEMPVRNLVGGRDITDLRFSYPEGSLVATTGKLMEASGQEGSGTALCWRCRSNLPPTRFSWTADVPSPLSITGNKNGQVVVGYNSIINFPQVSHPAKAVCVDLAAGRPIRTYHPQPAMNNDLLEDRKRLILSPNSQRIYLPLPAASVFESRRPEGIILDAASGREISVLKQLRVDGQYSSDFSPNSKTLAVSDIRSAGILSSEVRYGVRVFDVESGKKLREFWIREDQLAPEPVTGLAFSPSGNLLVMATEREFGVVTSDTWISKNGTSMDVAWKRYHGNLYEWCGKLLGLLVQDDDRGWIFGSDGVAHVDFKENRLLNQQKIWQNARSVSLTPNGQLAAYATDAGFGAYDLTTSRALTTIVSTDVRSVQILQSQKPLLLSAHDDAWMRLTDVDSGQEICRLIIFPETDDWLVVTPSGLFDGSHRGRQNVMFRIGGGLNVVPVDRFFQDFYYPGLLAAIWRGERPVPKVQLGEELPPLLAIETPERGGEVDDQRVVLTATATDQGGGIKGPSIRHNGATLIGAVQSTERTETGIRRTFVVDLIEGQNTLEIVSASADGSFESEPVRVMLSYNKPLPKSRLHVLVVGIDVYADESLKMNYAVSDADGVANVFAQRGGSLYEQVNVVPLRNETATRHAILEAVQNLASDARPQDTVVVFLSGHGSMVDQNFYFLPQDFHRSSRTLEEDIRKSGLAVAELGDVLAQIPALKRMVVFDTGQSGRALPVAKTTRNPFAFRGAIERLSRAQGAFTIASAAVSDDATEVPDLGHGILSYSFLAGLKAVESGPLVDQWVQPSASDKVAQALDLFSFASSHARQLGKKYFGQEQEVQYSSSGMTFPVLPVDGTGTTAMAARRKQRVEPPERPSQQPTEDRQVPDTAGTTLHVVAVGINEYAQTSMNLRYAAPDAEAIGELFHVRSQKLFEHVSVTTLLNADATREQILKTLQSLASSAKPEDTLAVFFAGHGVMVGQRYYFVPHEFDNSGGNAEEVVRTQGLAADELGDTIAKIPALKRMLVFDTCASGGAIHLSNQGADPFAFRGAIEQLGKDGGTFTLAAVSSSAEAQEVKDLGHGILSYCLLAGAGAADTGPLQDRSLQAAAGNDADVLEWFNYAAGNVPRLTKQFFGREEQVQLGGTGKAFALLQVLGIPTNGPIEERSPN